jgi:hypothetical protein
MRQFQFIVQFFAVVVLLIHSIVPHHHHAELSPNEHQQEHLQASNLLDYIALSLHFDHPDGQLEEFTASQSDLGDFDQFDLISELPALIAHVEFPVITEGNNPSYTYQADSDHVSTAAHSLRGPPTLS